MLTPEQLKTRLEKSEFEEDMQNALKKFGEELEKEVDKGKNKMMIPGHYKLGNLFYYDDKQEALAQRLIEMGYKCKYERETVGGVVQHPQWFLYFA